MSIAGGLVASESLPKTNLSEAYVPAGEGKWVVLSGNTKVAVEHKKGETVPEGFAVINIDYGNDMTEMGPVPVTHGTWTIMVPRGSNRILPLSHVNVLNDAITTEYFQRDMSSQLTSRSGRRFNFRVIHWPKTGEKRATEFEEGARDLSVDELENSRERHEVIELDQD
jgi:hypothetical protein|tara:strand:- start:863 stop:1366 length:504 start_codon:yes stop_codon:yes gene_type:complete